MLLRFDHIQGDGGPYFLVNFPEGFLRRSTDRADPSHRKRLEGSPWGRSTSRVALRGVVNVAADRALVLVHEDDWEIDD